MKSHKHLWEILISDDNIIQAIKVSAKNKRKNNHRHKMLRLYAEHPEEHVREIRDLLESYEMNPEPHAKIINDGISAKKRIIIVPTYLEVIMYNAVANVLKREFKPHMYEHSYASIPGRGTHKCLQRIKKWIRRSQRTLYVYKIDISGFFKHVNRRILIRKLSKVIHDKKFLGYLTTILWSTPKSLGLPLGYPTSQWLANFYLTELDFTIAHNEVVYKFARFMDDMAIFIHSKDDSSTVKKLLHDELGMLDLEIKHGWRVFPLTGDLFIDFLGYRIYQNRVTLRHRLALRIKRKAKKIYIQEHPNIHSIRQMVTYLGYFKHVKCRKFFNKYIQQYVNPRRLRSYVSKWDRTHLQAA